MRAKNFWLCLSTIALNAILSLLLASVAKADYLPLKGQYEVGSTPGNAQELVLKAINSAQKEIQVAAYAFSSKPVADALDQAHKKGVKVSVVCEKKGNNKKSTVAYVLVSRGIGVRLNSRYSIQHNKLLVIDRKHVQTGSFSDKLHYEPI